MSDLTSWISATERALHRGDTGSAVLRRRFRESIDDVWHACTDVERLRRWFGDVRGNFEVGATVHADLGERELVTCRIVRCEAPRLLAITWAYGKQEPDEVELRLTSNGSATILELGWEDWMYKLSVALEGGDGRSASSEVIYPLLQERWTAVRPTDDLSDAPNKSE